MDSASHASGRRPQELPISSSRPADRLLSYTALAHGIYWLITGAWPLIDIRSFQGLTGPKRDFWLVKTAGTLIAVIGGVLGFAGYRRRVTPELALLGAGSAVGLASIDIVYVRRHVIWPIYLGDAAIELTLSALWIVGLAYRRRGV